MLQNDIHTYTVNCVDSDDQSQWMRHRAIRTLRASAQDSGRARYIVTIDATRQESFEAALEADDDVIEYER